MKKGQIFWVCITLFVHATAMGQVSVFRPQFGVPAFVEPGGVFTAEVRAASGLDSNGWFALAKNDLRSWTCSVDQVAFGAYVYNNTLTGYLLRIQTPTDIPPETFKLVVGHVSAGSTTNRHALSVVPCLQTNFYVLHYADPQASGSNALYASGMNSPYGSIEELYWHAPVFSLINPRFLFNTGDELDDGDVDTANRYAQYLNAMDTVGPPILITRGNNDRGSFDHWKTNIGQACYHIAMGSFSIWMNDTRDGEMYTWFTNAYANSFSDTNVRYRLFGQHFHNNSDGKNPYYFAPPASQSPDLMLVGHNHTFSTLQTTPYRILSSGPAHNYGAFAFFEFRYQGTNWICPQATNHPTTSRGEAVGAWGAPRVSATFASPNDGSATSNTAFVTNTLPFNFWDGRVRFLMAAATAGYVVSGGVKLAEYRYNATSMAVVIRVNILAETQQTVSVTAVPDFDGDGTGDEDDADDDNDGMPDTWETAYGLNPTDASDADGNPDGDAFANVLEYIAGTDPTNAASVFSIIVVSNGLPFVIGVPARTDRWYSVYARESLLTGTWEILTNNLQTPTNTLVVEDGFSGTQRFYRFSVKLAP